MNVLEFRLYMGEVLEHDPESLAPIVQAMESLYESEPRLEETLTISLMEDVLSDAEERGIDLRRIAGLLPGPCTQDEWKRALAYTHPECAWDPERGLVRNKLLAEAVGKFRLSSTFEFPERNAFVLQGRPVDGIIRTGLDVRLEITSGMHAIAHVDSIEYVRLPAAYSTHRVSFSAPWVRLGRGYR